MRGIIESFPISGGYDMKMSTLGVRILKVPPYSNLNPLGTLGQAWVEISLSYFQGTL